MDQYLSCALIDIVEVGGRQLEAAIYHLNIHGRIVASGTISELGKPISEHYGIKNLILIPEKRLKMEGFLVSFAEM